MIRSRLSDVVIPEVPIPEIALNAFQQYAKRVALVDEVAGISYTYGQLHDTVRRLASGLARLGMKRGDIVAIHSTNNVEFFYMVYAILATGATVTTINPSYTHNELVRHVKMTEPTYIYASDNCAAAAIKTAVEVGNIKAVICMGLIPGTVALEHLLADDGSAFPENVGTQPREDVAFLLSSSGTTGLPKAVMITHYNVVAFYSMMSHPDVIRGDLPGGVQRVVLAFLPLYHAMGLIGYMIDRLLHGSKLVVLPGFQPEMFLRALERHKVNDLIVVPSVIVFLAKSPLVSNYDLSSIKKAMSAGAPLKKSTELEFKARLQISSLTQGYGQTEQTAGISVQPQTSHRSESKEGSSGQLLPNVMIKIVDPDTKKALGAKERGELWVKAPIVMKGYYKNPEADKETLDADGWLHTGDIGFYDEDGYLYIVDRLKELIKYKGLQVAPAELEELILNHPLVADVGVIGIPDERAGELPKAFVVKQPDATLTAQDIQTHVAERASNYKQLRGGVEFVAAIPKLPSGKILRKDLRAMEQKSKI